MPPSGKTPERIEIEADPRHAEVLIKNSGLQPNSKGVEHTRRASETVCAESNFHHKMPRHTVPMRLAYLSADRIELQFARKELISTSDGGTDIG